MTDHDLLSCKLTAARQFFASLLYQLLTFYQSLYKVELLVEFAFTCISSVVLKR